MMLRATYAPATNLHCYRTLPVIWLLARGQPRFNSGCTTNPFIMRVARKHQTPPALRESICTCSMVVARVAGALGDGYGGGGRVCGLDVLGQLLG